MWRREETNSSFGFFRALVLHLVDLLLQVGDLIVRALQLSLQISLLEATVVESATQLRDIVQKLVAFLSELGTGVHQIVDVLLLPDAHACRRTARSHEILLAVQLVPFNANRLELRPSEYVRRIIIRDLHVGQSLN